MAYLLFLLTNAALFLRPGDVVPDLKEVQVYQALIVATLVFSLRQVIAGLTPPTPFRQPITLCVLGLWAAVVLSLVARMQLGEALKYAQDFGKIVLYYLLLVGLVDSPARLRSLLAWFTVFAAGAVGLAVLYYHDCLDLPGFLVYRETWTDPATGEQSLIGRLGGAGIFNDPNDICLICSLGTLVGVAALGERRLGPARFAWVFPIALFLYTTKLSQSRGGMLGLVAGLAVLARTRYGWRGLLAGAVVFAPLMFVLVSDRQTSFDVAGKGNTGQDRVQLWSDGLALLHGSPVFGIGAGRYEDEVGLVAHNSFVQAFVELGPFGGTCFAGAFYLAIWPLARLTSRRTQLQGPEVASLQPLVLAIVVAYAVGNLSLSRNYVVPTYLVLGLAAACLKLAGPAGWPPALRTPAGLIARLAVTGAVSVTLLYGATRLLVNFG
jgi:hypothetical protein